MKHTAFGISLKRWFGKWLPERVVEVPVPVPVFHSSLLSGRVALVTGGTRGIGNAIARAVLDSGGGCVITGRNPETVARCVDQLRSRGQGPVHGIVLEMQDDDSFPGKYKQIVEMTGGIDILVNNAGLLNFARFGSTTREDFDAVLHSNLRGAYMLSQIVAGDWIEKGVKGNILNVCSSSSVRPANSPYSLSKWALRGMTPGLAKVLAPYGITVNGIAPGPTATVGFVGENNATMARPQMPSGRLIAEEEIANLAVVLVSAMGRMVMGDVLYVTAGCGILTQDDCRFPFGKR